MKTFDMITTLAMFGVFTASCGKIIEKQPLANDLN
jgi:hypothetical protein